MNRDDLRFHERGPSVPPDEPTALNKERAGHGAKHVVRPRTREGTRLLGAPIRDQRLVVATANICESAKGSSVLRAKGADRPGQNGKVTGVASQISRLAVVDHPV